MLRFPKVLLCSFLIASASIQATAAPELSFLQAQRLVGINVQAGNGDQIDGGDGDVSEENGSPSGPFQETVFYSANGATGASASAAATQDSNVTTFRIDGEAFVEAAASNGGDNAAATSTATSLLQYVIQVPEDALFSFTGSGSGEASGDGVAVVQVSIVGQSSSGGFIYLSEQVNTGLPGFGEPIEFLLSDVAAAGTNLTIQISAQVNGGNPSGSSQAEFAFSLDFGDRDGDGLLDAWEEQGGGIDIDEDGTIELDLYEMGARPNRKDVFVELDIMAGVPFHQSAIDRVVAAFANAPVDLEDPLVGNGVNLHVHVDDRSVDDNQIDGWDPFKGQGGIKDTYFGFDDSPGLDEARVELLRRARRKVFRYGLWANEVIHPETRRAASGIGEIPGNDFIVAAGWTARKYPEDVIDALAGTFMHELGHTLGLDHGGKNDVNHKPNYISVMNYSYQVPHRNLPANVVGYQFRLDYSREEMSPLIEDELIEGLGADGAPDDWIIWNEAADGQPPHIGVDHANADEIDWNGRNDIESPNPVAADLNRYYVSDEVRSGETLTGSNDWGRLWYHLSGHGNFGYGVSGDPATDPSEWDQDRADAFEALPVTDYTVPEPSAPLMLALGGLALAAARRRRPGHARLEGPQA